MIIRGSVIILPRALSVGLFEGLVGAFDALVVGPRSE